MKPGPNWNHEKGVREQADWDEHARLLMTWSIAV